MISIMIEAVKGKIKIYQRLIKRNLSDGRKKTYTTQQYQVRIDKNDLFSDGEEVMVLGLETYSGVYEAYAGFGTVERQFNELQERYSNLKDTNDEVVAELSRLRNKHDHLQERLRKTLEEINDQQRVISDLSNRGFLDYVRGRLPESYKQLNPPK